MKLNVKSLTAGLDFHGEVQGKRQHYYVLSSARQYFVMSVSRSKRGAGNFNLVGKAAVDKLFRRLRGRQGLTATRVFSPSGKLRPYLQGRVGAVRIHPRSELFYNKPPGDLEPGESPTLTTNGLWRGQSEATSVQPTAAAGVSSALGLSRLLTAKTAGAFLST